MGWESGGTNYPSGGVGNYFEHEYIIKPSKNLIES